MMKKFNYLFVLFLLVLIVSCSDENWELITETPTIENIQDYIENNPESEYLPMAQIKLDSLLHIKDSTDWEIASEEKSIESYQKYVDENPNGMNADYANRKILEFTEEQELENAWKVANVDNTVQAYEDFLDNYPESDYTVEAKKNIFLKTDENEDIYIAVFDFFEDMIESPDFNTFSKYLQDSVYLNNEIYSVPISKNIFYSLHIEEINWEHTYKWVIINLITESGEEDDYYDEPWNGVELDGDYGVYIFHTVSDEVPPEYMFYIDGNVETKKLLIDSFSSEKSIYWGDVENY
jgi:hypothetical protein